MEQENNYTYTHLSRMNLKTAQIAAASLTGVSKLYGSFAALRNLSLEIRAGECVMVLGENGAGKSTLLRMLAGLIRPTMGTVQVLGGDVEEERSRIGYMSHAPMLYDELTALENLKYFEGLYFPSSYSPAGCTLGTAGRVLTAVGLDPKLTRPVGDYSQGMRQRASLARAILSDPELLLLDEPFSNLDAAGAAQMVTLLAEFRSWPLRGASADTKPQRTIVLTTHQPQLAESLADRIITMRAGQIVDVTERAR
jgi:ABC-type multidrug transport system ATPase subunit